MYLLFASVLSITWMISVSAQGDTQCRVCKCQFNNIDILNQLVETKIASAAVTGVTYTRWGSASCPSSTGAELVYSGRAGGSNFNVRGGAAEIICLPDDPDYSLGEVVLNPSPWISRVQGTEYEYNFGSMLFEQNAPCAVCFIPTRSTSIMIPAKSACPSSWTLEYHGYLVTMAERYYRQSYNCLDVNPGAVAGHSGDADPALFYPTVTDCNGLSCPPYRNNTVLHCAVCTR